MELAREWRLTECRRHCPDFHEDPRISSCMERTDRGPRRHVDFIGEGVRGTRLRRERKKHRLARGLDIVLVPTAERVQAGDGPMAHSKTDAVMLPTGRS